MDNNAFVFYLEKLTIQLLRINILAETSIKIANGFLKRLCISYCPAFSYSVRTIRRKTNRKQIEIQKSVFYQVWIKRQKHRHVRIALINRRFRGLLKGWCAEDIWCNWFPCLSAATHIGSYSFFHTEQCMIMSECFYKHRTPFQYPTPRLPGGYALQILFGLLWWVY